MAMQIVDGEKLDRSLTATADRIREVTGETSDIPFDYAGETGFAAAIPEGGGGILQALVATENRVYNPPEGVDGFSIVTVAVETPQYSPRCDVVLTFDWGSLQGYWGFDDVYPTEDPPAPPEPGPDPDPPAPSLYPQWATGTDVEIAALLDAAAAGSVDLQRDAGWRVGDVRRITLLPFVGGDNRVNPAQQMDIVISSFDDYNSCGNVMQFDFAWVLDTSYRMNTVDSSVGGYARTEMYQKTLPELAKALPTWLKSHLVPFSVLAAGLNSDYEMVIMTVPNNKLALRSEVEIFGETTFSTAGEGSQIPYYEIASNRAKGESEDSSSYYWWERSARPGTYCSVSPGGNPTQQAYITGLCGVSPFGCLGAAVTPDPDPDPTPEPTPTPSTWTSGTDDEVAAILDAAAAGTTDLQNDEGWRIGDVRRIRLDRFVGGDGVASAAQYIDIAISSFAEYNGCGNIMQFDFACCPGSKYRFNPTNTTVGGYGASEMKTVTLPALAEALPDWLKTRLKTFSVQASAGGDSLATVETVTGNKLALRSVMEVTELKTHAGAVEGSPIPYYQNSQAARKKTLSRGGDDVQWWLRSADTSSLVWYIGASGGRGTNGASITYGLAPFGCL